MKTNFDRYLVEQLKDPVFAAGFKRANEAWDEALKSAALGYCGVGHAMNEKRENEKDNRHKRRG